MTTKNKTRITFTVTAEEKKQAEAVAEQMGLTLNNTLQVFISQMIKDNALPFQPTNQPANKDIPSLELLEALDSLNTGKGLKSYTVDSFKDYLHESEEDADD